MKTLITITVFMMSTVINAQTVLFQEDFNLGLPVNWMTTFSGNATGTWDTTSSHYGFDFDSTPFMKCYDWNGLVTNEVIESPFFSDMGNSFIYLQYDFQFLYQSTALEGFVDVFNGLTWQNVRTFNGLDTLGADSIDISTYGNSNMKIRFRFVNNTGNLWEHDFMIDNVKVTGNTITTIGLSEITKNDILIYPNPTENFIYWKGAAKSEIQLIEIYNLSGQIIKSENAFRLQTKINVSDLKEGVYFLKLTFENGQLHMNKIFKK